MKKKRHPVLGWSSLQWFSNDEFNGIWLSAGWVAALPVVRQRGGGFNISD